MSDKRLLTATIGDTTYKLGEELNVPIASITTAGIIKVGTSTSSSIIYNTPSGETKNYMIGIDGDNKAYVTVPSTTNTKIASKDTAGVVCIPNTSGLKLNSSTGALTVNLKEGYGIGTSTYDNQNPSYLMLENATPTTIGGIKTGYTNTGNKYGVKLDNSGNAYVDVNIPVHKIIDGTNAANYCIEQRDNKYNLIKSYVDLHNKETNNITLVLGTVFAGETIGTNVNIILSTAVENNFNTSLIVKRGVNIKFYANRTPGTLELDYLVPVNDKLFWEQNEPDDSEDSTKNSYLKIDIKSYTGAKFTYNSGNVDLSNKFNNYFISWSRYKMPNSDS